ncbi:hypothetical protein [Paenibacillus sp. LHD-38]|uniref:hypothetical protein n=1 Tax=Paenibacillus sp. LHD-38 TaxID=3072143 RepID=UPI00280F1669|nr:hypothetical protein [Paenibacillus sp. LHD-38]MDQ8733478.1 hypothetical protein [Paenibacillus sp. LHD-38]
MKLRHAGQAAVLLFAFTFFMAGCGNVGDQRTPEEWLSLSYSGLAATDQYAFTGSMSIKAEDGLAFKPETFEGKVVDHQQLTLQTNSEDPLHWNPVQVLEALNQSNENVRIASSSAEPETITLVIKESAEVSKERWRERLLKQLDQLGANRPEENRPYLKEWTEEFTRSRNQLEGMLASLQADTEYELVIDRDRMLPLKMEEKTSFHYKNDQKPYSETRYTTVRFQSFNGASSETVQQKRKHVTID